MLQINLFRMQGHCQLPLNKLFQPVFQPQQKSFVLMHNHKVIDIAPVIFDAAGFHHKLVKEIKIKIGKNLRSQITDRQPLPLCHRKQAFRLRQPFPVAAAALDIAVVLRVVENHLINQLNQQQTVRFVIILQHKFAQFPKQDSLVNAHKKRLYVHLQDITVFGIILRTKADKFGNPVNPVLGSFSLPTAVTVINKLRLKQMVQLINNQMMYDSVAEIGGKYFPLHRLADNKGDRSSRHIAPVVDIAPQAD